MNGEKDIYEIFSPALLPSELAGTKVCALKIDTQSRFMSFSIKLARFIGYDLILELKRRLTKEYKLGGIEIEAILPYTENFPEFLDKYKGHIIGELSERNTIYKYIFDESIWEEDGQRLKITLRHGCASLLYEEKANKEIENLIKKQTGKRFEVTFFEDIIESPRKIIPPAAENKAPAKEAKKEEKKPKNPVLILGKKIEGEDMQISEINAQSGKVICTGEVFYIESRDVSQGKKLVIFYISDKSGSIICKFFAPRERFEAMGEVFNKGIWVKVRGEASFDTYEQDLTVLVKDINLAEKKEKTDRAEVKRVELHAHTQMSAMDSVAGAAELVKRAARYGHRAVAITDHGVVQAFPEAFGQKKNHDIKVIYGTEAYIVNDCDSLIYKGAHRKIGGEAVVFDIETTGLNPKNDVITEIGAVIIKDGEIAGEFSSFANPGRPIPKNISGLTGITDEMVRDAPPPSEVVEEFLKFCGDRVIIAHNAEFDTSFIREECRRAGREFSPPVLDTLALCRAMFPDVKRHRLNDMADLLKIENAQHHRAVNDARVCAEIWLECEKRLVKNNIFYFDKIDEEFSKSMDTRKLKSYHAVILAKDLTGLKNLYQLVSLSHLKYFHKTPRIPKSEYIRHREGLLIGTACEAGELYRALLSGADTDRIDGICSFYDYFEIQPLGNNEFLIANQTVRSEEDLKEYNKTIVQLGKKHNKPVVATCDVHFLDPEDEVFRRILMAGKKFEDADRQAPLYFRTTDEMLREFEYLGEEDARRVVIENTNLIADMIEDIRPIPKEKCPPVIEGADKDIEEMSRRRACEIYGDPLPKIVQERMEKELKSIIKNGFAVMYMIAHKIVKKSYEDGYIVGSRGSVGSSLVAFLTGITEVNALPPHYVCPKCQNSEFIEDGSVGAGYDMEDKDCPKCGTRYHKDGHDIPFETFLGFDGDKAPDIDLNFSGEYQSSAHKYTEELFSDGSVYRAGTIGTIAEKTAYGFVKSYFDERGLKVGKAEIERLKNGCIGVKRTTGQHPGGIIIVPRGHDIHEFTPVQRPADNSSSDVITTHFDYHSIDENLLKLDLLGHDDPTVIKMLEDLTGVDALGIPLDDRKVISLFSSTEALGVAKEEIGSDVGTFGVPEFGTRFVRQMLVETKPKTFSDLVRISGLSHGTDVWTNNAQNLVRSGTCTLSSCICTRDDIMLYLMYKGVEPKLAFTIMESVRKGRGLKPEWEDAMREKGVPGWYINSCKTIQYMFPKAHATAYVIMAFRIAYFKVYYPLQFYMAYFSVRADDFDYNIMAHGPGPVKSKMKEITMKGKEQSAKEKSMYSVLEVCNEMYCRGMEFCPIDLYRSDAGRFLEVDGKILPPLNSIQGLGITAAKSIVAEREKGAFLSVEDFVRRTGVTKTVVELLSKAGCLKGMPQSSQISFFD